MIWDILMWLAIGYVALVVIWLLLGTTRRSDAESARRSSGAGSMLLRMLKYSSVGLVVVIIVMAIRLTSDSYTVQWSETEAVEVQQFLRSLDHYDMAIMVAGKVGATDEDWETVKANLQTSLHAAKQVSAEVLDVIHPELSEHYQNQFIAGVSAGVYGLQFKTSTSKYNLSSLGSPSQDSLDAGRSLLRGWLEWYDANSEAISRALGQPSAE